MNNSTRRFNEGHWDKMMRGTLPQQHLQAPPEALSNFAGHEGTIRMWNALAKLGLDHPDKLRDADPLEVMRLPGLGRTTGCEIAYLRHRIFARASGFMVKEDRLDMEQRIVDAAARVRAAVEHLNRAVADAGALGLEIAYETEDADFDYNGQHVGSKMLAPIIRQVR